MEKTKDKSNCNRWLGSCITKCHVISLKLILMFFFIKKNNIYIFFKKYIEDIYKRIWEKKINQVSFFLNFASKKIKTLFLIFSILIFFSKQRKLIIEKLWDCMRRQKLWFSNSITRVLFCAKFETQKKSLFFY